MANNIAPPKQLQSFNCEFRNQTTVVEIEPGFLRTLFAKNGDDYDRVSEGLVKRVQNLARLAAIGLNPYQIGEGLVRPCEGVLIDVRDENAIHVIAPSKPSVI